MCNDLAEAMKALDGKKEMHSYCYGDEVPVAAGTLPPIPNPDGRLRMQELYLRRMAMMNAMEENVGPGGGLANLKIFKEGWETDRLPVVVRIPAGPLGSLKCDPPKGNGRQKKKTRRRLARERKTRPSSSSEYGSRKK